MPAKRGPKASQAKSPGGASAKSGRARGATSKQDAARKRAAARKQITPRKDKRGLEASAMPLEAAASEVAGLTERVAAAGGAAIGAYREPLTGAPILLAALPIEMVDPTPFQRDLSPTHAKRLAEKIEESGVFLDPIIAVVSAGGRFWTPNGRHRLAAAKVLGLRQITALVSADDALAFRILALNTEKAHNLKDKSLESIRMARELARRHPRDKESAYASQLEAAELLTLGIVYEENGRFAGGAYSPLLKKVDRFADQTLPLSLRQRAGYAARIVEIDASVKDVIEKLQARGLRSPYLRNYVVARINPVRFHRAKKGDTSPPMPIAAALTRMAVAAKKFDLTTVRPGDLALVAALGGGAGGED